MEHIKNINELTSKDTTLAGGKGASLGELTHANIPVPPGFAILSTAFDSLIAENKLQKTITAELTKANITKTHTIDNASRRIQKLILNANVSEQLIKEIRASFKHLRTTHVAVRSSATAEDGKEHAWAGQLDTFLNTTEKNLITNIKKCWASLYTPRAIFYQKEKKLDAKHISVAVIIQTMIQSDTSGIAFSVHPVTENHNHIIIEAGIGLGEAIVSGRITPDNYIINKTTLHILEKYINAQTEALVRGTTSNIWKKLGKEGTAQKLSDDTITKLAAIIKNIEHHYGFPVDVEWACADGKIYVTQSRPITTLSITPQTTLMTKEHSRAYSFFRLATWYSFGCRALKKIIGEGITEACAVYPGGDLVSIYYAPEELKKLFAAILDQCKNESLIKKEITHFMSVFKKLLPYYTGKIKIVDIKQLREFQELYSLMWAYTAIIFIIPTLPVKKHIRELALAAREKTQKYNETPETLFTDALEKFFPHLAGKTRFILPEEAWSGEALTKEFLKKIHEREKGFIYYKEHLYTGNVEKNLAALHIQLEDTTSAISGKATIQNDKLTGTPAYPGRVTGIVRIITSAKDIPTVKEGDILVTAMTMPKYLPAMKKAAAFITDEGGVTCHAAIVARELKKPCIIGTLIATKTLHNGQKINVDATTGTIFITPS